MFGRILAAVSAAIRGLAGLARRLAHLPGDFIHALARRCGAAGLSQVAPPPPDESDDPVTPPGCLPADPMLWAIKIQAYAYDRQNYDLLVPPAEAPMQVRRWLGMLDRPEALKLAEAGPERILAHVNGQHPVDGVPPVGGGRRSEVVKWRQANRSRLVALAREEAAMLGKDRADPRNVAATCGEMSTSGAATADPRRPRDNLGAAYESLATLAR